MGSSECCSKTGRTGLALAAILTAAMAGTAVAATPASANQWGISFGPSGGSGVEGLGRTRPLPDGGWITCGNVALISGVSQYAFALRLDADGHMVWRTNLYGLLRRWLSDVLPLPDGSFLGIGSVFAESGDPEYPNGIWLVRFDSSGHVLQEQIVGTRPGSTESQPWNGSAILLEGGRLVLAGKVVIGGSPGRDAVFLVAIDPDGSVSWQRAVSMPSSSGWIDFVTVLADGSILTSVTINGRGHLLDIDASGGCRWGRELDGSVRRREDGEDGTALLLVELGLEGDRLVLLAPSGEILWERTLSCTTTFSALGMRRLPGGGTLLYGMTYGSIWNGWILAVDRNGFEEWQQAFNFGGAHGTTSLAVSEVAADGLLFCGSLYPNCDSISWRTAFQRVGAKGRIEASCELVDAPPISLTTSSDVSIQTWTPVLEKLGFEISEYSSSSHTFSGQPFTFALCPTPSVSLIPAGLSVPPGCTLRLTAGISELVRCGARINLASSNPTAATVPDFIDLPEWASTSSFDLTAIAPGSATITATLPPEIGGGTATSTVTVAPDPTRLALTPWIAFVSEGKTLRFTASLEKTHDCEVILTATSSDPSAVSVPSTVTIEAGQTSGVFYANALVAGRSAMVRLVVPDGLGGGEASAKVYVKR